MTSRIRRENARDWRRENPILGKDEPGIDTNTEQIKYGDGHTRWNDLVFQKQSSSSPSVYNSLFSGTQIGTSSRVNGSVVLTFQSVWGINSIGQPYYNTNGASPGEAAILTINPTTGSVIIVKPEGSTA